MHWNEIARALVASHNTNAPMAWRAYALVSVAQYASLAVDDGERRHDTPGDSREAIDAGFFRMKRDSLLALGDEQGVSTVLSGVHFRFDVDKGLEMGRAIATRALSVRDLREFIETSIGR